jgi:hypothetical protein
MQTRDSQVLKSPSRNFFIKKKYDEKIFPVFFFFFAKDAFFSFLSVIHQQDKFANRIKKNPSKYLV